MWEVGRGGDLTHDTRFSSYLTHDPSPPYLICLICIMTSDKHQGRGGGPVVLVQYGLSIAVTHLSVFPSRPPLPPPSPTGDEGL